MLAHRMAAAKVQPFAQRTVETLSSGIARHLPTWPGLSWLAHPFVVDVQHVVLVVTSSQC
jgi:hypothetical protein